MVLLRGPNPLFIIPQGKINNTAILFSPVACNVPSSIPANGT